MVSIKGFYCTLYIDPTLTFCLYVKLFFYHTKRFQLYMKIILTCVYDSCKYIYVDNALKALFCSIPVTFHALLSDFAPSKPVLCLLYRIGVNSLNDKLRTTEQIREETRNQEWQCYRVKRKDKEWITSASKAGSPWSVKPLILWQQKTHRSVKQCAIFKPLPSQINLMHGLLR